MSEGNNNGNVSLADLAQLMALHGSFVVSEHQQESSEVSSVVQRNALTTQLLIQSEQERIRALPVMQLTAQERAWAMAIKQAVEAEDSLQNLKDLEYVQYALFTRGNVPDCLRRMRALQLFRQEYGINDTLEQGMEMLQALLEQQPGFLLCVDKVNPISTQYPLDVSACFVLVFDFAKINPQAVLLPRDKRVWLAGIYYAHYLTQTTCATMLNGIIFAVECEGMTFDNISLDLAGSLYREFKSHYPIRLKEMCWYRAATAATALYALCKHFLPPEVKQKIQLGCDFTEFQGRLDELLLTQPTPEANNRIILERAKRHLTERCWNAEFFQL